MRWKCEPIGCGSGSECESPYKCLPFELGKEQGACVSSCARRPCVLTELCIREGINYSYRLQIMNTYSYIYVLLRVGSFI